MEITYGKVGNNVFGTTGKLPEGVDVSSQEEFQKLNQTVLDALPKELSASDHDDHAVIPQKK